MSADLPGRSPAATPATSTTTGSTPTAGPVVRAFALTGGRARTSTAFDLLAHVVATDTARPLLAGLAPELRDILSYADRPVSVAEVASHVDLPLGVVRVLLSDLLERDAHRDPRTGVGELPARRPRPHHRHQRPEGALERGLTP